MLPGLEGAVHQTEFFQAGLQGWVSPGCGRLFVFLRSWVTYGCGCFPEDSAGGLLIDRRGFRLRARAGQKNRTKGNYKANYDDAVECQHCALCRVNRRFDRGGIFDVIR